MLSLTYNHFAQRFKQFSLLFALLFALGVPLAATTTVFAQEQPLVTYQQGPDQQTCAAGSDYCGFVGKYLNPIINFLAVGFGIICVISVVFAGIQYTASQGDPQKIAAAKKRIIGVIIAIVTFAIMYSVLQFLVPGGLF